jgi:hypothetical protein
MRKHMMLVRGTDSNPDSYNEEEYPTITPS